MHGTRILAATALAALALNIPVAHAATVQSRCGFDALAQETVTGSQDTFTGAAYGIAVFDDQAPHTLRCYVTVDGVERSSTLKRSGTVLVVTGGQVTYDAPEGAAVGLCTEVDGLTVSCADSPTFDPFPPNCIDCGPTLDDVLCPLLVSSAPGVPGVVDVDPEDGDVTIVALGGFWDCPPYGDLFPPA